MTVRPFRPLGQATFATLQATADGALAAWRAAFGASLETGESPWTVATSAPDLVHACWRDGRRALWLGWDESLAPCVQAALFGAAAGAAPLAAELTGAVLAALVSELAQALLPANQACPRAGAADAAHSVDAAELSIASGAAQCSLRLGDGVLQCVLSAAAVEALAPVAPAPRLAPLPALAWRDALAGVPVRLTIDAGCAEVGAGSLLHCGPGDVIRLDTHAGDPLSVRAPGGARLFYGFLGRAGDAAAVEVTQHF